MVPMQTFLSFFFVNIFLQQLLYSNGLSETTYQLCQHIWVNKEVNRCDVLLHSKNSACRNNPHKLGGLLHFFKSVD